MVNWLINKCECHSDPNLTSSIDLVHVKVKCDIVTVFSFKKLVQAYFGEFAFGIDIAKQEIYISQNHLKNVKGKIRYHSQIKHRLNL